MVARLVLILGGTMEAAALAHALAADPAWHPLTSLAGRTTAPAALRGEVRIGGFGGSSGLAGWLKQHQPVAVIDATHPFARRMPHHAKAACSCNDIPRLRVLRPLWQRTAADRWIFVDDAERAVRALPSLGRMVFLSTGQQDLPTYLSVADQVGLVVRSIEPLGRLPGGVRAILGRPPFTLAEELALFQRYWIDVLVTKASGGSATFAKIEAARQRQLPVVMLTRPPLPDGPCVDSIRAALDWLAALRA